MPTQIAIRPARPPAPGFRRGIRHIVGMAIVAAGLKVARGGLTLLADMEAHADGQR